MKGILLPHSMIFTTIPVIAVHRTSLNERMAVCGLFIL